LKDLEKEIDRYVEKNEKRLIDMCVRLIDIKSVTGDEYDIQLEVFNVMKEMGLEIDFWEPDDVEMRASKLFSETGESMKNRPVVVGIRRGKGGGKSLMVNGHVDTVNEFPIEKWNTDPFKAFISDGKIFGRGASDMKSGLAMSLFALNAITEMGIGLDGDVYIVSVPAEENGGNGTVAALVRGYHHADAAIFPEPTSNHIQPAHRGAAFWRIHINGKAAHGGSKYKGISAVEKGFLVAQKLSELEKWRNDNICSKHPLYKDYPLSAPVTLGIFKGGQFTSGVPETCMLEGCIEFVPGEKSEDVRKMFEQAVLSVCDEDSWMAQHPPNIEWFGLLYEPAETDESNCFVQTAIECFRDITNREPVVDGFEAGTDMRLVANEFGIPGFMFGPGDIFSAHAPNEFVNIEQLKEATKILMLLMIRWCNNERERRKNE
jgi:acetylornithine deacetylase